MTTTNDNRSKDQQPRIVRRTIVCVIVLYFGSYVVLSRLAMAQSEPYGTEGYCFVDSFADPLSHRGLLIHYLLVVVYCPMILLEYWLGTGASPMLSMPLLELSGLISSAHWGA